MACRFGGRALRVPWEPARRSVRFRKPSAKRRQLWAPNGDIARGARRLQDSEAMDAALRVKLAVVDRPTFAQAQLPKDNQRQTDVSGPDRQVHWFLFCRQRRLS